MKHTKLFLVISVPIALLSGFITDYMGRYYVSELKFEVIPRYFSHESSNKVASYNFGRFTAEQIRGTDLYILRVVDHDSEVKAKARLNEARMLLSDSIGIDRMIIHEESKVYRSTRDKGFDMNSAISTFVSLTLAGLIFLMIRKKKPNKSLHPTANRPDSMA